MQADPKTGYYRPPGPQQPQKYPFVGSRYGIYGEQPGYVYNPWSDTYKPDPKQVQQYAEQTGFAEKPKEPAGFADIALPIAGASALVAGGKYLGENIGSIAGDAKDAAAGLLGYGAEATQATQATQAGSMLPGVAAGGEAVQVGTAANGGALMSDGTIAGGSSGIFNLGGGLAAGEVTAASAGAGLLGAYGAYDLLSNKKHGTSGALQGAASGAGIGTFIMPGLGTGIGAGIGALVGYFGNFGDVDAYKTEWKRKKDLFDKGIISEAQLGPEPRKGRSKEELIAEAQATGGNVTFARSRNESDLTPADIQGYAAILEEAHKRGIPPLQLAEMALQSGAVREHHGTIDVEWGKVPAPTAAPAQPPAPAPQQQAPPLQTASAPQPQPSANGPVLRSAQPGMTSYIGPNQSIPSGLLGTGPAAQTAARAPLPIPQGGLPELMQGGPKLGGPSDFGIQVPPGVMVPAIAATKEYWENWAKNPQNLSNKFPTPQVNLPLLMPGGKSPMPLPPPGLLGNYQPSNAQPLAPAPIAPSGAPPPQPAPRPIMPPQNQISSFNPSNGYDRDRDGPWVSFSQPGLLSVRS